jgi:hypothetical protein
MCPGEIVAIADREHISSLDTPGDLSRVEESVP